MSLSIPEHYRRAFADNFTHVIQQEVQKLGNKVRVDPFTGKQKVYDDMDDFEFVERVGRLTDSNPSEVTGGKRQLTKREFVCQKIFDKKDKDFLGNLGRPDSEVMQGMRYAWNRTVDTKIAEAAISDVYGGAEPYVTPIPLPSSQKVDVNYVASGSPANSGLTPHKILRAIGILEANDIDLLEEECCIAFGAKDKEDLVKYIEAADNDVWAQMIKAFIEGRSGKIFGLTPVMSNRIVHNTTSDIAKVVVWSKRRGIIVAPDRLDIKLDVLPTKHHAIQISAYGEYGFMRRHEKAVVEISVDRSPPTGD